MEWLKNLMTHKKGQQAAVASAIGTVLLLVVLGIMVSINADVVQTIQDGQTANSFAANASGDVLSGIDEFAGQMPTIWLVGAVGLIIAVLLGAFAFVRLR